MIKTKTARYNAEIIPFKFRIERPITPQLSKVKIWEFFFNFGRKIGKKNLEHGEHGTR